MSTYQPKPTYFRITWNLASPTNYTSVGGISPLNSVQFKNTVVLSGTVNGPTMTGGEELLINGQAIVFDTGNDIDDIIEILNSFAPFTNVMASKNWSNYLTLQSLNPVDQPISISGTALSVLGLPEGVFSYSNPIYGGAFTTLTNGHSIVLNGITVTFVTGGLNVAGACAKINVSTPLHGVVATPWTNKVQLNSTDGSPIYFGAPGSGTATTDLGFAINTAYGGAMSLSEAEEIERGNMRWKGIASTLGTGLTPFTYNNVVMTGSTTDGNQLPTTVAWTLGVENVDHVYCIVTAEEPETEGTVLTGVAAVKRLVARALVTDWSENRNVFNNELTVRGTLALRENPVIVEYLTAGALDTVNDIATIEDNLSVTMIPYV